MNIENKGTFFGSAALYILFNIRLGSDALQSFLETLWQIASSGPYIAGLSYFCIVLLQHMAGGEKVPWDRRIRLFFAIGIMAGLVQGILEHAGVKVNNPVFQFVTGGN